MKNLTKYSLIVFLSLFYSHLNAQTYGLKVGLNFADGLLKNDATTLTKDSPMILGFHIGPTVDVSFNDLMSLESGILLTTKGAQFDADIFGPITFKIELLYLEIPITLKATHDLGGVKIFAAIGPYIGIGLVGTIKSTSSGYTDVEDVKWGNDKFADDLKIPDWGLTFGGGVEINSIQFGIWYDHGLSNNLPNQDNGATAMNRVFKFSVGYRFGK